MKIKVSIIVPIHNHEKTLKRCVDSLLAQTVKEIEIILLNDNSTDGCAAIVDAYAQQDGRVVAIHECCRGFGSAVNAGIAAAKGEYITIVNATDWVEEEMCDVLYEVGHSNRADVVKCHYRWVDKKTSKNITGVFHRLHIDRLIEDGSLLLQYRAAFSIWKGALYSSAYLHQHQIRFTELAEYYPTDDIGLSWRLLSKIRRSYISCKCFYNISGSDSRKATTPYFESFIETQRQLWDWCSKRARTFYNKNCLRYLYENVILNLHKYCRGMQKFSFFKRMAPLLKECAKSVDFSGFSRREIKDFKFISRHPVLGALKCILYSRYTFKGKKCTGVLGVCVTSYSRDAKQATRTLLGVPYMKEKIVENKKKMYFMGICYRSKALPQTNIKKDKEREAALLWPVLYSQIIFNQHQKTFLKYRCCHHGQDVALIATGPSIQDAPTMDNVVCCGVNRAITMKQYKLQYCFMQDYPAVRDFISETFNYEGCVNFFGYGISSTPDNPYAIPRFVEEKAKAERYYTHWLSPRIYGDISLYPLFNYDTVAHCAFNFLLFTHPRRLFLIGCDCSSAGSFDSNVAQPGLNVSNVHAGYAKLKTLRDYTYPDVEIISVNPVGLRGMFRDMYTKAYLQKHPEIEVDEEDILDHIG